MNENNNQYEELNTDTKTLNSAAPTEKKSFHEFFEKNNKLIGTCVAGIVAILIIIATIFVIAAAANVSRMSKQQMEITSQSKEYLDQITNMINGLGDGFNTDNDSQSSSSNLPDGLNLDDLIDLYTQSNSNGQSNSGENGNSINLNELGELFEDLFGYQK